MRHPQALLLLPLLFAGCAQGGKQTGLPSDVKIAASHHLFGFRALRGFGGVPVSNTVAFPDHSVLNMFDDATYTITRTGGTSSPDGYGIATNGAMTIRVTGSSNEPTVSFSGGYGLNGVGNDDLFFVDRWVTSASPSVGMFYGTRVINGIPELEGGWHLLSLHATFGQSTLVYDSVGRAAHGGVSISAGTAGSLRTISGTGSESSRASLLFGGSVQALTQGSTGDGSLNCTISYQDASQPTNTADPRLLRAAAGKDIVLAVDEDKTDGEAGMVFMFRKFDAPTTVADISRVAGTYLLGAETLFVNPANPGSDAAVGTLRLTSQGAFTIDMVGAAGIDFTYSGTFTLSQDGALSLTVSGTNETWFGAIHRDYNTIAIVDDVVETRANPELNLFFGVRQRPSL